MKEIDKLLEVMATLRDPENGCPWDLQQDFASVAPYTIEEAYEVADAIERQDMAALRDELGDLLFQVVFHARMAEEAGEFDFDDVAEGTNDKMLRRHPHVFGSDEQRRAGPEPDSWEKIKAGERVVHEDKSALAGVAKALPALKRAEKLGGRASAVGFDWPDRNGVREKISEELGELEEAAFRLRVHRPGGNDGPAAGFGIVLEVVAVEEVIAEGLAAAFRYFFPVVAEEAFEFICPLLRVVGAQSTEDDAVGNTVGCSGAF